MKPHISVHICCPYGDPALWAPQTPRISGAPRVSVHHCFSDGFRELQSKVSTCALTCLDDSRIHNRLASNSVPLDNIVQPLANACLHQHSCNQHVTCTAWIVPKNVGAAVSQFPTPKERGSYSTCAWFRCAVHGLRSTYSCFVNFKLDARVIRRPVAR